jgi:RNA polymerase sigma-70 factor (ECF subfamily)
LAEDITSETFARALRAMSSLTYRGKDVSSWLMTIARNLINDHLKSNRYRREISSAEPVEIVSWSTPERAVMAGAGRRELLCCINKLTVDQRRCVVHRFLEERSVGETAVLMDRNDDAVKALQSRAIRRLGELLPAGIR